MLTNDDLFKIGQLLDKRLGVRLTEFERKFEAKLDGKLEDKFDKKLKPIHRKLNKLQKDLTATIDFFDNDVTDLKTRMDQVESNLHSHLWSLTPNN